MNVKRKGRQAVPFRAFCHSPLVHCLLHALFTFQMLLTLNILPFLKTRINWIKERWASAEDLSFCCAVEAQDGEQQRSPSVMSCFNRNVEHHPKVHLILRVCEIRSNCLFAYQEPDWGEERCLLGAFSMDGQWSRVALHYTQLPDRWEPEINMVQERPTHGCVCV